MAEVTQIAAAPVRLWQRITAEMNPPVFFGAGGCVIAFCIFGAGFTDIAEPFFNRLQSGISRFFGWYYVLVVTGLLLFSLWLGISRVRHIRIGGPGTQPEFGRLAWFSMLFAAGMGIGLVFWAVAEPLMHYDNPLLADPRSEAALKEALRLTFFHWGLHAWGIYVVLALGVAYFHFNKGMPLAPRSIFYPLLGYRINGWIGHAIDILCTVGTLLGVATSLGIGAIQINAGLAQFFDLPIATPVQLILIAVITLIATISVVSGVQAGIRRLSMANLALAFALFLFVLLTGPTLFILQVLTTSVGEYIQTLPSISLYLELDPESRWQSTWTLFYWGWWISWSPFVAVFVARISRGRTISEFVWVVLLVPTVATMLWLAVFGGTGLYTQIYEDANLIERVRGDVSISLHAVLQTMPLPTLSQALATLVITLFFITSSDSGSLVDDIVTSGGRLHPPKAQRVFWATSEGAAAITLLVVGGLQAMRDATISLGLPMSILLVAVCFSLYKTLRKDEQIAPQGAPYSGMARRV